MGAVHVVLMAVVQTPESIYNAAAQTLAKVDILYIQTFKEAASYVIMLQHACTHYSIRPHRICNRKTADQADIS